MAARTHGRGRETRGVYNVWKLMRIRCNSPTSTSWPYYGGRGIKVCAEWNDFSRFLSDMGEPGEGMTLERKDVNGNYEKSNCCWIPKAQQRINTRHTHQLTFQGRTQPLSYWAREIGISSDALKYRIAKHGLGKALTTPRNDQKVRAGLASIKSQGKNALRDRYARKNSITPICLTKRRNLHPTRSKDTKREKG